MTVMITVTTMAVKASKEHSTCQSVLEKSCKSFGRGRTLTEMSDNKKYNKKIPIREYIAQIQAWSLLKLKIESNLLPNLYTTFMNLNPSPYTVAPPDPAPSWSLSPACPAGSRICGGRV
jgi:hypothetical protein